MSPEPNSRTLKLLLDNAGMIRFGLLAAFLFTSFFVVYNGYIYGSDFFIGYLELSADLASWLLNSVFQMNTAVVEIRTDIFTKIVAEPGSKIYVVVARGCDASTVFAVLIATVMAWPGPWLRRAVVCVLGLLLMYILNLLRIAGMLLVEVHAPQHFDLFHEWILPNILIVGALLYFYGWVVYSNAHPADADNAQSQA
ncbi:MAG: hypothetical protein KJP25_12560 [Gammaproteobacteria bacterium]|nr:hypothetical protein [Gammaproteobacteria bacterium]NNL11516.1 hypothetical protein [Pseudomonadales bacterium]NNM11057.1 hypothetical protein [Pseudomonadales bacterium]RZV58489.1 MAG: hypothetical protein EX270_02740 [Pseudomonadales bacterium]